MTQSSAAISRTLRGMTARLRNEPALIVGFVQAVLALAVSFGLDLDGTQVGAIAAFTTAATAVFLRQQVSPVGRVEPAAGALGFVPTPEVVG